MSADTKSPGLINGPVYRAAHGATAYLNVPPNLHRLRNAVGLTVGIYAGRKLMNILTGETPEGKKIDVNDVIPPLRPLHGILAYDHFSDDPAQRWMKVLDMVIPAVLGGVGASIGSISHYRKDFLVPADVKLHAPAEAFTLGDAERQSLYYQAKPAALAASHAAGYGSASGFGIIPSWLNFSSMLGWLFTLRAERQAVVPWLGKDLRAGLLNSHSLEPFRPTKLAGRMIDHLVRNPNPSPQMFEEAAEGILKTWFRRANLNEEKVKAFKAIILKERDKLKALAEKDGKTPQGVKDAVREGLEKFLSFKDKSFEERLIGAGLDPREAAIGDAGFLTTLSRWMGDALGFGTTKNLKATQEKLIKGVNARHKETMIEGKSFLETFGAKPKNLPDLTDSTKSKKIVAGTLLATGAGTIGAIMMAKDTGLSDLPPGGPGEEKPAAARKHRVHSKRPHGIVNGKILDTAEGVTGMFNAGIGMHRVHCAMGLTVGSWLGDKVMEALTGVSFPGKLVAEDEVFKPLRKIYKKMPFNPSGDHMRDKWMQVLRWAVPAITGTMAVIQGSKIFFEKRTEKLKTAQYIDEMEDKATMAQSQPWSYTSAISGLFGFPSGLPMLPLVNYSTNLGTRFSMGSGRKVAMPLIGKWWSNNSTLFPFGPSGMTDLLIREAVNNKSFDPELLETYAIGILKPWFDNVTAQQVESFVMHVHEVRDRFFREGGVPEEMKKQLEAELRAHFKGAGLEHTLEEIGLDPLKATLASNGLSGTIANILGAKGGVEKIKSEYAEGYRQRMERHRDETPAGPGRIA